MTKEAAMERMIETVLAGYESRAAREAVLMDELPLEEMMRRADEFLFPVGPDTGSLLNLLIKALRARTILELGTSYGYSAIFLAEAARTTGGVVISIDVNADKQRHAREQLVAAGLESFVELRAGDAREIIASLPEGIDFVLIDLWKELYIPCFDLVYPKLSDGALLAADNILYSEFTRNDMVAYRRHVRGRPGIQSMLLPVGHGIELSRYAPNDLLGAN
jgi:predicted O-methyltransferase YrrM